MCCVGSTARELHPDVNTAPRELCFRTLPSPLKRVRASHTGRKQGKQVQKVFQVKLQISIPAISMQQEETEGVIDNEFLWFNIKRRVAPRMREKKNPTKPTTNSSEVKSCRCFWKTDSFWAVMSRMLPGISQGNNSTFKQHYASYSKCIENHLEGTQPTISFEYFCH